MFYNRKITKKLGELLLERKIIDEHQLEQALRVQKEEGGFLSQVLLKLGFVTEIDIATCLSSQYGFPYLPLKDYVIDPQVIKIIPADLAWQCDVVPLDKIDDVLTIAMVDPLNLNIIEELSVFTGCRIQPFIATRSDIINATNKYYGPLKTSFMAERVEAVPPLTSAETIIIKGKKTTERRRFLRINAPLSFHYAFQEEYKKAQAKNISAIGILFVSENIIPLWTFLILKIEVPDEELPIKAVGQVVRVDMLPDRKYDIAVHLTHLKSLHRAKLDKYVKENIDKFGLSK